MSSSIHPGDKSTTSNTANMNEQGKRLNETELANDAKKLKSDIDETAHSLAQDTKEATANALNATAAAITGGMNYVSESLQPVLEKTKEMGTNAATMMSEGIDALKTKTGEMMGSVKTNADKCAHWTAEQTGALCNKCIEMANSTKEALNHKLEEANEKAAEIGTDAKKNAEQMAGDAKKAADNTAEKMTDMAKDTKETVDKKLEETKEKASEMGTEAKKTAEQMTDDAKKSANDTAKKCEHWTEDMKDKACDKCETLTKETKDAADHAADTIKDAADNVNDKAKDVQKKGRGRPKKN